MHIGLAIMWFGWSILLLGSIINGVVVVRKRQNALRLSAFLFLVAPLFGITAGLLQANHQEPAAAVFMCAYCISFLIAVPLRQRELRRTLKQ